MMKAWCIDQYGSIDDLKQHHLPIPSPKPDEILVRIQAAALNPADHKVITGKDGGKFLHASRFPLVPGFDFSGILERHGAAVEHLNTGEEVFGFLPYSTKNKQGTLSEYVAVPADTVGVKPEHVSHAEAAGAATVGCTALQALRNKGRMSSGQRILINGASGGVGSFAVQLAKHAGAEVWGTASGQNLALVKSLGADEAIDYRTTKLSELRGPFDIVLDAASTSSYGEVAGILQGVYITLLPSMSFVADKLKSLFSSNRCTFVVVSSKSDDLNAIARDLDAGRLKTPVADSFDMEQAPEAFRRLIEGKTPGKIILTK